MVKPFLDDKAHGVFATRFYSRPNPIGISVVQLIERTGLLLKVQCVDMLDGTPLLDIKPYIPEFDVRAVDTHLRTPLIFVVGGSAGVRSLLTR